MVVVWMSSILWTEQETIEVQQIETIDELSTVETKDVAGEMIFLP